MGIINNAYLICRLLGELNELLNEKVLRIVSKKHAINSYLLLMLLLMPT